MMKIIGSGSPRAEYWLWPNDPALFCYPWLRPPKAGGEIDKSGQKVLPPYDIIWVRTDREED